ncbi:MAG: hypothetical protein JXA37_11800 [Chloroflexia bacterium]|nr:hypothetical protein [Chloroflexia bacterium]
MAPPTDGRTWDFSRCSLTKRVTLWPRELSPHYVGQAAAIEAAAATGPGLVRSRSPLNSDVRMLRLSATTQHYAASYAVAVAGEVAAGRYDVTVAYHDSAESQQVLLLPPQEVPRDVFALRVRGDSMREAGILDGDYVLVRPQQSAQAGDLVIAALSSSDDPEGYVTLKQFFQQSDHVRLQPANRTMAPIHLYPQNGGDPLFIQGKVVAVVRLEETLFD